MIDYQGNPTGFGLHPGFDLTGVWNIFTLHKPDGDLAITLSPTKFLAASEECEIFIHF